MNWLVEEYTKDLQQFDAHGFPDDWTNELLCNGWTWKVRVVSANTPMKDFSVLVRGVAE